MAALVENKKGIVDANVTQAVSYTHLDVYKRQNNINMTI